MASAVFCECLGISFLRRLVVDGIIAGCFNKYGGFDSGINKNHVKADTSGVLYLMWSESPLDRKFGIAKPLYGKSEKQTPRGSDAFYLLAGGYCVGAANIVRTMYNQGRYTFVCPVSSCKELLASEVELNRHKSRFHLLKKQSSGASSATSLCFGMTC
jgi:hypothetical protein